MTDQLSCLPELGPWASHHTGKLALIRFILICVIKGCHHHALSGDTHRQAFSGNHSEGRLEDGMDRKGKKNTTGDTENYSLRQNKCVTTLPWRTATMDVWAIL